MKKRKKRRRTPQKIGICYLCGKSLRGKVNKDHIPPKQMFPSQARKANLSKLYTQPTHESCNKSYQEDEKYFADLMATTADIRPVLLEPRYDLFRRKEEDEKAGTTKRKFIKEVKEVIKAPVFSREGHILIPPKEPERIDRVTWKIIRGLYFIEHQIILQENTKHAISRPITFRNQRLAVPSTFSPEEQIVIDLLLRVLENCPSKGKYPEIFDYRYKAFSAARTPQLRSYLWALILYGSIIIAVAFDIE